MAAVINSYRLQAERRASLSRAPVSLPAARLTIKPPLALPPWGYGGVGTGRVIVPLMPPTTSNATRRSRRPKSHSSVAGKQGNSSSSCETSSARHDGTAFQQYTPTTQAGEEAEFKVGETKNADSAGCICESSAAEPVDVTCASSVAPTHPGSLQTAGPAADDMTEAATGGGVVGGGPVASSSMETWTTEDNSTSPRVQSTASSPHSLATPDLASTVDTPLSLPSSALSWLRPTTSPTTAATASILSSDTTEPVTCISLHSPTSNGTGSHNNSPKSTSQGAAGERPTVKVPQISSTPQGSADDQKNSASSAVDTSTAAEITAKKSTSQNSHDGGPRRTGSKTSSDKSPPSTSKTNVKDDKSSLMVGLVKVKSRHTGLMIDCPILETVYQNDMVETAATATAVRKSSSHKVVLIKAVVPRWAWNGRGGEFTPVSSSRASGSSANTSDRAGAGVGRAANSRSSHVSVDTQTSETLLATGRRAVETETQTDVRRTSSDRQQRTPSSPLTVVDTLKYVPAADDRCLLVPSPKLPNSSARASPKTPTRSKVRSGQIESRVLSSPHVTCQSPLSIGKKNLILREILTEALGVPSAPQCKKPTMPEKAEELEAADRRSTSIECDSLMEDNVGTLKLDLQFSSSGNTSDNDSVTNKKNNANRSSSSSSVEMEYDRKSSSPKCQKLSSPGWSYEAANASKSNTSTADVVEASYGGEREMIIDPMSLSSVHQERAGRARSSPSQGRSATSDMVTSGLSIQPSSDDASGHMVKSRRLCSSPRNDDEEVLIPGSCSRPKRSPCPWRSAMYNDDHLENSPGRELSYGSCHCEQQQHHSLRQQLTTSNTQYASRSESSLSDHSQSILIGCCDGKVKVSQGLTTSSNSPHVRYSSTLASDSRWIDAAGFSETSPGSDVYATVPFDYSTCPMHHRANNSRPAAATPVDSSTRQSRRSRSRPVPPGKHPATKAKSSSSADRHQHLKQTAPDGKRSTERQRTSAGRSRRDETAQSSRSTGSVPASAGSRRASATAAERRHSSSAARRMPPEPRTHSESRHCCRDAVKGRRISSVSGPRCCLPDKQRRRVHPHAEPPSTADPMAASRHTSGPASSCCHQRRPARPTRASASASADSLGEHPDHRDCSKSVAEQFSSSQAERHARRVDAPSPTVYYQRRPSAVYYSPRSNKPFPPPISDRCPSAGVESESVKYVLLRRTDDTQYGEDEACTDDYPPPSASPPPRHRDRCCRALCTAATGNKSDHQRRDNVAKASSCECAGRRRMKRQESPAVDGPARSSEARATRRVDRPAWKH